MTTANTTATSARTKASVGPVYFWGILLFTAFTLLVIVWFKLLGPSQKYDDKRAALRAEKLQALRLEDRQKLSSYAWANKEKGIAQIPVDRAMDLIVTELKSVAVSPSTVKVENPYPAGLAQQAAAPQAAPAPEATK